MPSPTRCMLVIVDGWGIGPANPGNAVRMARIPFLDRLLATYPSTTLACAGEAVGLPEGIMGNSEVGHLNIGAGRVVYQDIVRIDRAIRDGSFFKNEAFTRLIESVKFNPSAALHLMGLVSDGGVHSHTRHLDALLDLARGSGVPRVCIHAITDGRDTGPQSGIAFIQTLQEKIHTAGVGSIATLCGRYFAMDRDTRWDRTLKAYRLYTQADGIRETDPVLAVQNAYASGQTDEFIQPIALVDPDGHPLGRIRTGDGVVFFNFRADRARQITRAFTAPDFDAFERGIRLDLAGFVCMTLYDEKFDLPLAFPPVHLKGILGEVVSAKGLRQLRIAETEKYAHVTYFFNGGQETPFPGEDRCMVPSPREVPTYDLKPEMSAAQVTEAVLSRIESDIYDLIVLNFANLDMVGHTGDLSAAIRAAEVIDGCVEKIVTRVREKGGTVMVTADHGNAEQMRGPKGETLTAHSLNPVPCILVDDARRHLALKSGGKLGNIAPTLLDIMGIEPPGEMTEPSLLPA